MMKRLVVLRRREPAVRFSCCGVRYGECRRNHAASTGGHAVDGCREFIAAEDGGGGGGNNTGAVAVAAAALKCAACGCHRSFHRRVQVYEVAWDYCASDDTSSSSSSSSSE